MSSDETAVARIRPYRPADREALYDVCARTADAGSDATGLLSDDRLWGDIFAVPYVERHPDLAWVVESADGRVVGYIVATDDTDAFRTWFRDEWWPRFHEPFPRPTEDASREDGILEYAYTRGPGVDVNVAEYPAHLHIDLLPEVQGQGLGRRLMATLFAELARRGVHGLQLSIDPANDAAAAFYQRLGMHPLPVPSGGRSFGVLLAE